MAVIETHFLKSQRQKSDFQTEGVDISDKSILSKNAVLDHARLKETKSPTALMTLMRTSIKQYGTENRAL